MLKHSYTQYAGSIVNQVSVGTIALLHASVLPSLA